ncbi:carboxylesterase [Saccharophagus degradans]|uniref:alpha/beta hydrolase n=1 Tax=Saccharophagus degradans TaxID=86304 RepID=UPI001C08EAD4|nr:alpha/beta fold hydrolase [Saccharophagus degradans]MBU2987235.1 carboxylesterase [Saccharophagus degradans]
MTLTPAQQAAAKQTRTVVHGAGEPTHAVIWLHGLGASSDDFPPVIPYLGLSGSRTIRFVFPQAPERPITINGGMVMPGWYDIKGMDLVDKEDLEGMSESRATLERLIQEQVDKGVPTSNIIIAGFSQGGAVAYYTGLRYPQKLAGIMALSTYMPFAGAAASEHSGVNVQTPIMAMHGLHDGVVPLSIGKQSADAVKALGYTVEWKGYAMEHNVIPEQLTDIGAWLNRVFEGEV